MVSYNQPLKEPISNLEKDLSLVATNIMDKSYPSIREDMTINEVSDLISKHKLTGVPVVNEKNRLIGIISEKDCLKYLLDLKYYNGEESSVKKYMSRTIMSIHENEKLIYMAELFIKNNYQLYPVIDDEGLLKGVVTRSILFSKMSELAQTNW